VNLKNSARSAVLALFAALAAASAFPQSQATTGQITGRAVDSQGGALPGVTVAATNPATGFSRSVSTNAEGLYTLALLPPGTYEIAADLAGFQTVRRTQVPVTVGSNVNVDIRMGVAGVAEAVTVEGSGAFVETGTVNRTATLNSTAIENLPINGRRFQDFVTLTPTAQVDTSRGQISLAGQRGINTNISVDGADYNQPFFGGIRGGERSNFAFTIPQESIQEFQVVASGYSAEFGRSSGGIVNAITKSGTNQFKGSAFFVDRDKGLASKNVFNQNAAPTQKQFGGSFGGPLQKDRVFFFAAYEQQKVTDPRSVLFDTLVGFNPTADQREAFDYYKSLETPFDATNDARAFLGRLDFQLNTANRLSIRYSHSSNEAQNATSVGNSLFPTLTTALSNNGTEKDSTNTVVGQYTSVLTPKLLLEVRGQYSKETRPRIANVEAPNVTTNVGRFGTVNFLSTTQYDWRGQGAANLTWISGNHTAKFGAEYNHVFANQTFGFNQHGLFSISGTNTATILDILSVGGPIANRFDNTSVTYLRQIGNLLAEYGTDEIAVFAQDSWKIRPNFTVNYGLRWEGAHNPTPPAENVLVSRLQGFTFPNGRQADPTQIPSQWNQFGPRVGFAWDPANDAKSVVRGYGGVYYARSPALLWAGAMNNFRATPGDLSVTLPFAVPAGNPNNTVYKQLKLIGIDLNGTPLGSLPELTPQQLTQVASALGLTIDPFRGANPIFIDSNFKNPRAYQAGLGYERQVSNGLTVGIDGVIVKTDHLQRNLDLNEPRPTVRANDPAQRPFFGLNSGVNRPISTLGQVTARESTARSLYQAMTLSLRLQRRWGQANVFYVLSHSKSDDDNERDSGGFTYENAYNLTPEYADARLDRRHQFNGNILFFLPYGFDVSSAFAIRSGLPIDVSMGSDANQDRGGPDRPYSGPGVPFTRNAFRNRAQKDLNVRAQKSFKIGDRQKLVLTAEVFNVFNFDNIQYAGSAVVNYCATPVPLDCGFGAPTNLNFLQIRDQNPTSARVGQYLLNNNPGPPRQVQLGVRFQF
jgi:hypothetical protein